jgi:hypothetical protein
MANFYIEEINSLAEEELVDLDKFWEEFEEKYKSQESHSEFLLKSLVKVAFTQGYVHGKARQRPTS